MEKVLVLGSEAINVNLFLTIYVALLNEMSYIPSCVAEPGQSPKQPKGCNKKVWICGSIRWERGRRAVNSSGAGWGCTKYRGKSRIHSASLLCLMRAWQRRKWWSELWENTDPHFLFFNFMQNVNVSTSPFLSLTILCPFLHLPSFQTFSPLSQTPLPFSHTLRHLFLHALSTYCTLPMTSPTRPHLSYLPS